MRTIKLRRIALLILFSLLQLGFLSVSAQAGFDKSKDLILFQHDTTGDEDDLQAIAVEGCYLLHPDADGINYWAVTGTRASQKQSIFGHEDMMSAAFGTNWSDAWANWDLALNQVKDRVRPYLDNGGAVWVMEAGQSDFTRDWCQLLIDEGVAASTIKSRVKVIQHSEGNEKVTTDADLAWVKANTAYTKIDNGNLAGNDTPRYVDDADSYRIEATSDGNPNVAARAIMLEFERVVDLDGTIHNPKLESGGIDFSDTVALWYTMEWGASVDTVSEVWSRYVANTPRK